jgi:hypothetical protein
MESEAGDVPQRFPDHTGEFLWFFLEFKKKEIEMKKKKKHLKVLWG